MASEEPLTERVEPSWLTRELGPKAQAALLERLRPLVYLDGQCSCCGRPRTPEEQLALSEAILTWWTEYKLDDGWNEERTEAAVTTE